MNDYTFNIEDLFEEIADDSSIGDSPVEGREPQFRISTYLSPVQSNANMYLKDYRLFLGTVEGDVFQGLYSNEVQFLLVSELSVDRHAARQVQIKNDGRRETLCISYNGLFPEPRFLGTQVLNKVTGNTVTIGFSPEGDAPQPHDLMRICDRCPLAQGAYVDGKYQAAMCAEQPVWVIYVLPQTLMRHTGKNARNQNTYEPVEYPGGLARVRANSLSVMVALRGRDPRNSKAKSGFTKDGSAYRGINWAFTGGSEIPVAVPLEVFSPSMGRSQMFMGYGTLQAPANPLRRTPVETDTHAWMSVKPQIFAPLGRPETLGDRSLASVPLHPVVMYTEENDYGVKKADSTGWLCPQFDVVKDQRIPVDVYAEYLRVCTEFRLNDRKNEMMGLTPLLNARAMEALSSGVTVQTPSLPSGNAPRIERSPAMVETDIAVDD